MNQPKYKVLYTIFLENFKLLHDVNVNFFLQFSLCPELQLSEVTTVSCRILYQTLALKGLKIVFRTFIYQENKNNKKQKHLPCYWAYKNRETSHCSLRFFCYTVSRKNTYTSNYTSLQYPCDDVVCDNIAICSVTLKRSNQWVIHM